MPISVILILTLTLLKGLISHRKILQVVNTLQTYLVEMNILDIVFYTFLNIQTSSKK
jgi:hypothetical protein